MKSIIKKLYSVLLPLVILAVFSLVCIFKPADKYSYSERRDLKQFPKFTAESFFNGKFFEDFGSYAADQFPLRDSFRSLKANFAYKALLQTENNSIYLQDGYLSKLDYPQSQSMQAHAVSLFGRVYKTYIEPCDNLNVYLAVLPDKNEFLADEAGVPKLDFDSIEQVMANGMPYAQKISVRQLLCKENYYLTDTHWKQETIIPVAEQLAAAMGVSLGGAAYKQNGLAEPFYGVYCGQSALSLAPEKIIYLTNDTIDGFTVTSYDGRSMPVYDLTKAGGKDAYEIFLGGTQALFTIENPANTSGRRLILFRDSFGSSLAPLLAQGYSETVVVDLRYINSAALGQFVDFENSDVLFMYSTLLLNSSLSMQ